jgi:hypothetical protein
MVPAYSRIRRNSPQRSAPFTIGAGSRRPPTICAVAACSRLMVRQGSPRTRLDVALAFRHLPLLRWPIGSCWPSDREAVQLGHLGRISRFRTLQAAWLQAQARMAPGFIGRPGTKAAEALYIAEVAI